MFRWTAEKDSFLALTRHLAAKEVADYLGISPHAVYQRRSKIGISFHKQKKKRPMPKGETRKWPPTLKMVRNFIMSRDHYVCHYCGDVATQVDHKIPVSHGGSNITTNLVASCAKCNNLKGNACYECPKWREQINV
jgi:hypothetical protein